MNDRHFHLTLPSNASTAIYPNNTAAMYVTKLPKPIELEGEWVASLKEISTPVSFVNIPYNYAEFDVRHKDASHGGVQKTLAMPGGMYRRNEEVLDRLNEITALYNIEFHLAGRRSRRIRIDVGDTHEIRLNENLAVILGLSPQHGWYASGEHVAGLPMTLPSRENVTTLFVYCDILQHVVVGDTTAPLLRVVDMRRLSGKPKMHTINDTPLFVPIQKKMFDTIEVNLMTDTGMPVPFEDGKSHVVLELKKIGLLDGAL